LRGSRVSPQLPQRKSYVLENAFDTKCDDIVAFFAQVQIVAELPPGGVMSMVGGHAFGAKLFLHALAMEGHLLIQFPMKAAALDQ